MNTRIYFASKTRHAHLWRYIDRKTLDVAITGTWIWEAGPGRSVSSQGLWNKCILEVQHSDGFLLYAPEGEQLIGALVELGAALASGVPVVIVGGGLRGESVCSHPGVVGTFDGIGEALDALRERIADSRRTPLPIQWDHLPGGITQTAQSRIP